MKRRAGAQQRRAAREHSRRAVFSESSEPRLTKSQAACPKKGRLGRSEVGYCTPHAPRRFSGCELRSSFFFEVMTLLGRDPFSRRHLQLGSVQPTVDCCPPACPLQSHVCAHRCHAGHHLHYDDVQQRHAYPAWTKCSGPTRLCCRCCSHGAHWLHAQLGGLQGQACSPGASNLWSSSLLFACDDNLTFVSRCEQLASPHHMRRERG